MYIDPSTGGMLFQILAVLFGVISGIVLLFSSKIKMGYRRFLRFIRERRGQDTGDTNPEK
ncbi:MAG: hypothetical protein FJ010_00625 [Chloroflexi bacterium]|nr:hypothetical protein [Chloroflexota bacterium]